jgi:beta-glucuronidase
VWWLILLSAPIYEGQISRASAESPPAHSLNRPAGLTIELQGPVQHYLAAITQNWLLPAPASNPAILAMFADRDRAPYRDLLPWSGEFAGKYLTGATAVLETTGDARLRAQLGRFVAELVRLQDADGYLGPFPRKHRLAGSAPNIGGKPGATWDAWGHYHAMLGLLLWHEATGEVPALTAARKIGDLLCNRFLGSKRPRLVDTGSTEMNLAPVHGLCLLYERTGEKRYLEMAHQLVDEFAALDAKGHPLAGDYLRAGLAGLEFHRLPKPRWESIHPVLALAELARIERDQRYGKAFTSLWWSIARLDRHNNGGFASGEQAQGNSYHRGAIETCCTIAWMAMTVEMLRLTGDPIAADELELTTLNSAMGLFSPTGRWSTYNTPMDGDRKANFQEIVFQSRPGSPELNCCSVNAARGLGMVSQWALMSDAKGDGLTLNWYGPARFTTRLPAGSLVRLSTKTDYPRTGLVQITVTPERSTRFPLRLRIPQWSGRTIIKVKGQTVSNVKPATYLDLTRVWEPGDVIDLELDLTPHVWTGQRECAGRASIYRGPILLTYDPRFNPGKPADPPPLDLSSLNVKLATGTASPAPMVLTEVQTRAGPMLLCDFASAGFDGSSYRSWLRAEHGEDVPFQCEHSWRTQALRPSQPGIPAHGADASFAGPRSVWEVASDWLFQIDVHDRGEVERWFDLAHDRSGWRAVEVPRAWDTFDESLRGYEGVGWYSVALPQIAVSEGKRHLLKFGRVMYHTKAWLNGEYVGENTGGYLPFSFDITGKLARPANQLVLRVDNRPRIDWLPAAKQIEWVQYGGILQPVRIEARSKTAIASLAIRAIPRQAGAAVTCVVEVEAGGESCNLLLRIRAAGREQTLTIETRAGQTSRHEVALFMEHAEEWSPDSPTLYDLTAALERGGQVIDKVAQPFGVRSIEARGRRLLLNGRPLTVHGANRYDEYGRFGPNPPWELVEQELRLMKRAGVNLIRTHYPQAPELLALCDRMGILFLEELPINWWGVEWFGKEGAEQNDSILNQALRMLETMIRRDRNHPCVIIWSMCNESRTDTELGIKVMRRLIRRTHELDGTRLVTFVTAPGGVERHRAYEDADLVATNMYPGSLAEPHAEHISQLDERARKPAEEFLRRELAAFPDKPLLIAEFGAMGFHGIRGDAASTEDFQASYISKVWNAVATNPDLSGGILWSWADYYHRRHFQSLGAFGPFGVVTVDRQPKESLRALSRAFGGSIED